MTAVRDENVEAVGFDITSLSVAELERRGVKLVPAGTASLVGPTDRRWLSHSEADVRYPHRQEHARGIARQAARWHVQKHGTLDGLVLSRSFPCMGLYRVDPEGAAAETGPVVVVCALCGDRTGIRREEFDEAIGTPPLSPQPAAEDVAPADGEPWPDD